jgi:hypothetical protein
MSASPAEVVFDRAVSPDAPLFALVDAARESGAPHQARQAGVACESLFAGEMGELLKDVAPHVIEFPLHSRFSEWWFQQSGNSIGVLLETSASLADVRRHFRTLMTVRDDQHRTYFFRFYDPRVLRVFLPSCTADELERFFGPIVVFHCEDEDGAGLLSFSRSSGRLSVKRSSAAAPADQEQRRIR